MYAQQKRGAKYRGIEFNLTFEQWRDIWGDNLDRRGRRAWQLVMCRKNDSGAYEIGNVYLGTPARNGASRRMALENRRGAESAHAHNLNMWRGDREVESDNDNQAIEQMLGMKTSALWL